MKKYIILGLVCLASFAKATTTPITSTSNGGCDTTTTSLYFCNISSPTDVTASCDNTPTVTTTTACTINTCGNGTTDCTGGNNPWCGGGTKHDNVPDTASSLGLLSGALTVLGSLRRKLVTRK